MDKLNPILSRLFSSVLEGYSILRLEIREDEGYGQAIIENPSGTPQTWYYNENAEGWQ